jgi:nicotinamidase-related amidase
LLFKAKNLETILIIKKEWGAMSNGQEKRKVYLDLKDIINPAHTALVVWDVQNLLVERIFNQEAFLKNLKEIIQAARRFGVPIIYSKITPLPREYESPSRTLMMMRRFNIQDPAKLPVFLQPGTPEAEIHKAVTPEENDVVLPKHTASMFVGTHFESMMRNRGIETIIFTGISTEMGIASSARDSGNRGFYTVVVEDAVSTTDEEIHRSCLMILERIVLVEPSHKIIGCWS